MRRYYPGFFGALFLILLRTAIGWHFLYEGTQKVLSTPEGKASVLGQMLPASDEPLFSSEGYLRASVGPLAGRFRNLIPDADSRELLDPALLKDQWRGVVNRIKNHFDFDPKQREAADKILQGRSDVADDWFEDRDNRERVKKYLDDLNEIAALENKPVVMDNERQLAITERKSAEADRRALVTELSPWVDEVRDAVVALATPEQVKEAGPYEKPHDRMWWLDRGMMYGLSAVGLCLMLGFLTPLAALGGATFLLSFYLSVPPFPGLPEGKVEGHYLFVNKNLIELIALLALAATPNGLWVGLDAFFFGWIGRGKARREAARLAELEREASAATADKGDRRKYKAR